MSAFAIDLSKPLALLAAVAVVGFVVGGFMLLDSVDFGPCLDAVHGRRARLVQQYLCSPNLLDDGWRGWFVLAWLWSFPILFAVFLFHLNRDNAQSE